MVVCRLEDGAMLLKDLQIDRERLDDVCERYAVLSVMSAALPREGKAD